MARVRPLQALSYYLTFGILFASGLNLYGLLTDRPTVFAADAPLEMWIWAFFVPIVVWPLYILFSLYHALSA